MTKDVFLVYRDHKLEIHGFIDMNNQFDKDDSKSKFGLDFALNNGIVS